METVPGATKPVETQPGPDRTTRKAALWATVVAVPVAVLVAIGIFQLVPRTETAAPQASASSQAAPVPSTPVQVAAPKLSARQAEVCLAVTSQLPATVRNLASRKVSAGPEQNAAFGEPALTVSCGVTQPKTCATMTDVEGCVPMDTELLLMNRVCWYADRQGQASVFTTMDREVAVRVSVPSNYEQPAQWANEFSDIVVETDKSLPAKSVPYGCTA
jgi:hypothetical protein